MGGGLPKASPPKASAGLTTAAVNAFVLPSPKMRTQVFAPSAVPGVDTPLLHKSQSYVDDMIRRGEAKMFPAGTHYTPAAYLTGRREQEEFDRENSKCGNSDWGSVHVSLIPPKFDIKMWQGGFLRITTKQMRTPKEMFTPA